MKDTEFTPGPWLWDGEIGTDHEGMVVGAGQGRDGSPALVFPNDADRALVLAAPDMFQALQEIVDAVARTTSGDVCQVSDFDFARAALSKAKGIDTTETD